MKQALKSIAAAAANCMAVAAMMTVGAHVQAAPQGAVFTASNAADGNEVLVFDRAANGALTFSDAFATGGTGTGMGLGNQGAVVLSDNTKWLLVVNAGSNDVSVFRVKNNNDLVLTDIEPSGGLEPISVTIHGDLVYVLNDGGPGNIAGFTLSNQGDLAPIPGSVRPLSGAPMPDAAQIQFTPQGDVLVVSEKATNFLVTYVVDDDGVAGEPQVHVSSGLTPFGFGFTPQGLLIVSEAFQGAPDASAVSSYEVDENGGLTVATASEPTTETAACWIAITNGGRFAYTTNTGSGSITGFNVCVSNGALTRLDADGVTADTGPGSMPIDAAVSKGSKFLYTLNSGTQQITGFRVKKSNGSLTGATVVSGLPSSANGLAAR